jgi:hypothetical protein
MRRVVHREPIEDLLDVGAADEAVVVHDRDAAGIRKDAEVGIGNARLQRAQFFFGVGKHGRVLHGDEAVVDALRDRLPRHGVVHEPPRHVDLTHRAARPRDHLCRQHRADAQLLAHGNEQRVHPGRVGGRELGQVADAHQHLRLRIAAPHLGVSLE